MFQYRVQEMVLLSLILIPLLGISSVLSNIFNLRLTKYIALTFSVINMLISLAIFILFDFSDNSYQFVQEDGSDEGKKKPRLPSAKTMPPGYFIESSCGLPQKGNCQPIMKPIQQFFEWSFHLGGNSLHKFRETLSPYSLGQKQVQDRCAEYKLSPR